MYILNFGTTLALLSTGTGFHWLWFYRQMSKSRQHSRGTQMEEGSEGVVMGAEVAEEVEVGSEAGEAVVDPQGEAAGEVVAGAKRGGTKGVLLRALTSL